MSQRASSFFLVLLGSTLACGAAKEPPPSTPPVAVPPSATPDAVRPPTPSREDDLRQFYALATEPGKFGEASTILERLSKAPPTCASFLVSYTRGDGLRIVGSLATVDLDRANKVTRLILHDECAIYADGASRVGRSPSGPMVAIFGDQRVVLEGTNDTAVSDVASFGDGILVREANTAFRWVGGEGIRVQGRFSFSSPLRAVPWGNSIVAFDNQERLQRLEANGVQPVPRCGASENDAFALDASTLLLSAMTSARETVLCLVERTTKGALRIASSIVAGRGTCGTDMMQGCPLVVARSDEKYVYLRSRGGTRALFDRAQRRVLRENNIPRDVSFGDDCPSGICPTDRVLRAKSRGWCERAGLPVPATFCDDRNH